MFTFVLFRKMYVIFGWRIAKRVAYNSINKFRYFYLISRSVPYLHSTLPIEFSNRVKSSANAVHNGNQRPEWNRSYTNDRRKKKKRKKTNQK